VIDKQPAHADKELAFTADKNPHT